MALKVCRLRGIKKVVKAGIIDYWSSIKYDTIIMYGNNFGLMQSRDKAIKLLNRMYSYTSEDGRIIAETMDVYTTKFKPHLDYQKYNRQIGRLSGQIRFRIRYDKYSTPYYDYLFVDKSELKEIVSHTKWKIDKYFENKGNVYIAILKKEPAITVAGAER